MHRKSFAHTQTRTSDPQRPTVGALLAQPSPAWPRTTARPAPSRPARSGRATPSPPAGGRAAARWPGPGTSARARSSRRRWATASCWASATTTAAVARGRARRRVRGGVRRRRVVACLDDRPCRAIPTGVHPRRPRCHRAHIEQKIRRGRCCDYQVVQQPGHSERMRKPGPQRHDTLCQLLRKSEHNTVQN